VPTNNDPKAIAASVNRFLADPVMLEACQKEARRAAEAEFCWEKQEEKLFSYYRKLTEKH
jgi:hypothetical protein